MALLFVVPAVLSAGSTTITLTSSANPAVYGHAVTLTAVVTPSTATGTVTFYDGAAVLESEPVANGQAAFTNALLPSGTNSLTAYYGGDSNDSPSKSAALVQTITPVRANGFKPATSFFGGGFPGYLITADFNGDGIPDLCPGPGVLLGNGDGTFHAGGGVNLPTAWSGVASGDFNGDGKADLALPLVEGYGIIVSLGNGDGTFQSPLGGYYFLGNGFTTIAVGDFNQDGKADIVATGSGIFVLLGNGDGTFNPMAPQDVVGLDNPSGVVIGDFNGDGKADLAISVASGVNVLLGNGDGTFQAPATFAAGTSFDAVAMGDFNGDGKQDLAVTNWDGSTVSVLLGNGDGTFQAAVSYPTGVQPFTVVVGDMNGDGKWDVLTSSYDGSNISMLLGNGDGTFQAATSYAAGPSPSGLVVGDFNLDGIADVITSDSGATSIDVLLGTENAQALTTTALTSSPNPSTYGQNVTLTATVSPTTATGMVTFYHGSTSLGTGTLSNGIATLAVSTMSEGSHSLTAAYGGDALDLPSTSPAIVQVVNKASTTTTLTSSPNPSIYRQNVTLTATVSPSTATGTVTFYHGTTSLGTGTLASGVATLVLSTLSLGSHSLTATYGGDANDTASTSKVVIQVVQDTTATILTSSPNPSVSGQKVTLTATVTPSSASGTVTFYRGSTVMGTGTLSAGIATYKTTTLPVGTHSLTASYGGDADDAPSTSPVLYQTVNKSQ